MKEKNTKNNNRESLRDLSLNLSRRAGILGLALSVTMGPCTPVVYAQTEADLNTPAIVEPVKKEESKAPVEPINSVEPVKKEESKALEARVNEAQAQAADGLELGPEIVGDAVAAVNFDSPTIKEAHAGSNQVKGKTIKLSDAKRKLGTKKGLKVVVYVTDNLGTQLGYIVASSTGNFTVTLNRNLVENEQIKITIKVIPGGNNPEDPGVTILGESNPLDYTVTPKPEDMNITYANITIPTITLYYDSSSNTQKMLLDAFKGANTTVNDFDKNANQVTSFTKDNEGNVTDVTIRFKDNTFKTYSPITGIKLIEKKDSKDASIDGGKIYAGSVSFSGSLTPYIPNTKVEVYYDQHDANEINKVQEHDKKRATVNNDGSFTYKDEGKILKAGDLITVRTVEPGDGKTPVFKTYTVQPLVPEKTDVRDPKKLTPTEKEAIIKKIRNKNMLKGQSLLPDGTGEHDGTPALIDIDSNGNVRIINPSNAECGWTPDYKPTYEGYLNTDGTYKVTNTNEITTIPVADIVNDIKPDAPTITKDDTKLTFAPQVVDTDAKTITIKYEDKANQVKTAEVTKSGNTWTCTDSNITINGETISLAIANVKAGSTVTATVKDEKNTSEPASVQIAASLTPPAVEINSTTGDVTITPPDSDKKAKTVDITYTPVGSNTEKTVTATKDSDNKWTVSGDPNIKVSDDGKSFTIENKNIKPTTDVKAKTKGDGNLVSSESKVNVPDKTPPASPEVKVNETTGDVSVTPPSDADVKTLEVKYLDPTGAKKTATATKGDDNTWSITGEDGLKFDQNSGVITIPYEKLKKGTDVSALAKDKSDNDSQQKTDTTMPPAPTVTPDATSGDTTVTPPTDAPAVDGMEITYTPVNGTQTKTIKISKGNNHKWKIEGETPEKVSIDKDSGKVTFKKGAAKENFNITAFSKIGELKGIDKQEGKVPDKTAPENPEVKLQKNGSITITPKKDSDTKTVEVKYNDPDGNPKTATATKNDQGKWNKTAGDNEISVDETTGTITIPKDKLNPGDEVKATAKDEANNTTDPVEDTAKPAPPKIEANQDKGTVTITPPTKGKVDGMVVKYKTPDNKDRKITVKKGSDNNWTIEGDNPDNLTIDAGTGAVTIPKGKAKEKTEVKADSKIKKLETPENEAPDYTPVLVPDKTAPKEPTVEVDGKGNLTITPPTDEDTTKVSVTYKKSDDSTEIKLIATKQDNNTWTLKTDPDAEVNNGESIVAASGVITIPKGRYKAGEVITAYGYDNVDNKSEPAPKTPVEVTFDANGGTKKIESSIVIKGENFVLPAIFAPEFYPFNKDFAGWQVGTETKKAGDSIKIDENTTVKALWKDKSSTPGEGGTTPGKDLNGHNQWWSIGFASITVKPINHAVEMERGIHYKYLYGYKDHTVRPEGLITRAEAAALIARLANLDMSNKAKPNFKDTKSAWYNKAINAVVAKNLMFADKNGNFRPSEPITRGEFARALFFIDKKNDKVAPFADVKGHIYEEAINQAYGNDRIKGYADGSFKPDATITRAEAATILNHYANRSVTSEGLAKVHKDVVKFKDINENHWAYYEIMEAANTYEYERVKGTIPGTWLEIKDK
ncbi:S-layer homology domain-containing protein [Peptoniphilus sp. GNH]|nr:S-layer homology domain-containing protein [Peptoniphilus sp. GNH]